MADKDYVLGTHDEEIARLGLQHRAWQPWVADAWRRAGIQSGDTVLDVGCGPGYAALDLSHVVGPAGQVVAVDRSRRFLDYLAAAATRAGLANVIAHERDLNGDALPDVMADAAWCRWVLSFVRDPRAVLARIARTLRPGGTLVVHEYYDYAAWRLLPPRPELEEFVAQVMAVWRADGGEPDLGRWLPSWLEPSGFELVDLRPIVHLARPGTPMWEWPTAFLHVGSARLVALGRLSAERAADIRDAMDEAGRDPLACLSTPAVVEIIARRR
jgi:ubiquinone/menaquinone biosynthesis C-methylase UbiE